MKDVYVISIGEESEFMEHILDDMMLIYGS